MPRATFDDELDLPPSRRRQRRTPRRFRVRHPKPRLTIASILGWADEFYRRKSRWPHHFDGRIAKAGEETWARVNDALAQGYRGLQGGSSLARLLYVRRGVRSPRNVPTLSEWQILSWAQNHFKRTGKWPHDRSGPIHDAAGETWAAIDLALSRGKRGLSGESSLARLLDANDIKRNPRGRPAITEKRILALADAFHKANGHWPYPDSGEIKELPGETWSTIDRALERGSRGLPGGKSLAFFLNEHRSIFDGRVRRLPRVREEQRLEIKQIVGWGKAYQRRHGTFPNRDSGPVAGVKDLKWSTVDSALKNGSRGLQGGSSLASLFGDRLPARRRRR